MQTHNERQWPNLSRLHRRAYGGEDVAVRPDARDEAWWPLGPLLPGVEELVAHAASRSSGTDGLNLYFLLGGAGNGKSFAARELANRSGLALDPKSSGLAQRSYSTDEGAIQVILLNDATIAPHAEYASGQDRALTVDLERWWELSRKKPVIAFCCVNRGIIIDEIRALGEAGDRRDGPLGAAVLSWLAGRGVEGLHLLAEGELEGSADAGPGVDFVGFQIDGQPLRLFALAVDSHSLVGENSAGESAACSLMEQVLAKCEGEALERDELCPIRANVSQLSREGAVRGWRALLDSAEMAGGRLFTYRDLWGLIVLSVLGPRAAGISGAGSPLEAIDQLLAETRTAANPAERLEKFLALAQFRIGCALFRAPVPEGPQANPIYPPSTPYQTGFAAVDPAVWGTEDTRAVEDAMTAVSLGDRPSASLDQVLKPVWSKFDDALEEAFIEFTQADECGDRQRRRLIAWYGAYLSRLVALSTGHLGNADAISTLRTIMTTATAGPSSLPMSLAQPLRALIFPSGASAGQTMQSLLVPAFAPRAEPVVESRRERQPILVEAVDHASVAMRLRRTSGRVLLECYQAGSDKILGQLLVDFMLVREALACGNGPGQTDATSFIEPRLERCRATTINGLPPTQRRLAALVDGKMMELGT